MEDLRELVSHVLERQGVLNKLRAELRANVFIAVHEQEQNTGTGGLAAKNKNPRRDALMSTSDGMLLAALVREFLVWCSAQFTVRVFDPEIQVHDAYKERSLLLEQLGLNSAHTPDGPLLMLLLKKFLVKEPEYGPFGRKLRPEDSPPISPGSAAAGMGLGKPLSARAQYESPPSPRALGLSQPGAPPNAGLHSLKPAPDAAHKAGAHALDALYSPSSSFSVHSSNSDLEEEFRAAKYAVPTAPGRQATQGAPPPAAAAGAARLISGVVANSNASAGFTDLNEIRVGVRPGETAPAPPLGTTVTPVPAQVEVPVKVAPMSAAEAQAIAQLTGQPPQSHRLGSKGKGASSQGSRSFDSGSKSSSLENSNVELEIDDEFDDISTVEVDEEDDYLKAMGKVAPIARTSSDASSKSGRQHGTAARSRSRSHSNSGDSLHAENPKPRNQATDKAGEHHSAGSGRSSASSQRELSSIRSGNLSERDYKDPHNTPLPPPSAPNHTNPSPRRDPSSTSDLPLSHQSSSNTTNPTIPRAHSNRSDASSVSQRQELSAARTASDLQRQLSDISEPEQTRLTSFKSGSSLQSHVSDTSETSAYAISRGQSGPSNLHRGASDMSQGVTNHQVSHSPSGGSLQRSLSSEMGEAAQGQFSHSSSIRGVGVNHSVSDASDMLPPQLAHTHSGAFIPRGHSPDVLNEQDPRVLSGHSTPSRQFSGATDVPPLSRSHSHSHTNASADITPSHSLSSRAGAGVQRQQSASSDHLSHPHHQHQPHSHSHSAASLSGQTSDLSVHLTAQASANSTEIQRELSEMSAHSRLQELLTEESSVDSIPVQGGFQGGPQLGVENSGGLDLPGLDEQDMEYRLAGGGLHEASPKLMGSVSPSPLAPAPPRTSSAVDVLPPMNMKMAPLPALGPLKQPGMPINKGIPLDVARKSAFDLKDELRRQGLLSSNDSLSTGASAVQSQEVSPAPNAPAGAARQAPTMPGAKAPPSAADLKAKALEAETSEKASRRSSNHGVFDGELTVSDSFEVPEEEIDIDEADDLDLLEDELDVGMLESEMASRQTSHAGRGYSLEFRASGLSASDHSGELAAVISNADLMESADI